MSTIDNIKIYLKAKKIRQSDFLQSVCLSEGYFGPAKNFSVEKLVEIANKYPDLNLDWLITDRGNMFRLESNQKVNGVGNNIQAGGNVSNVTTTSTPTEHTADYIADLRAEIEHLRNENKTLIAMLGNIRLN